MFIRAYLRASTEDQFADRAKEMLEQFVQERGHKIASYYRENISGTKLDRPELGRLLMDSQRNDICKRRLSTVWQILKFLRE